MKELMFKLKHHPEESQKRKSELQAALKRRLAVFMELLEKEWVDQVSVDQENNEQMIKFLDAVVIKLEGGTDFDLKVLDKPYEEEKPKEPTPYLSPVRKDSKDEEPPKEEVKMEEDTSSKKKRKRSRSNSGEENDDSSESESEVESVPPADNEDKDEERLTENGESESKEKKSSERSRSPSDKEDSVDKEDSIDKSDVVVKEEMEDSLPEKDSSVKEGSVEKEELEEVEKAPEEDTEMEKEEGAVEDKDEPKPRALHKTHSIFLRYLAPSITKQEVEALCKRFPGFLRVAIADPQPERRFVRRAWVTFERSVNIKEMCWNLNGIRLRDSELGAIVNRDLSRRIRSVNGISSHKQVVRADIKLAARIIQNLDRQKKLWDEEEKEEEMDERGFLVTSKNPLLKNITDYLIEEASAEEDELLGMGDNDDAKEGGEGCALERDEALIKVLDRLLLYLRVVHSVDYYNSSEYPSEDEMPNRCGIMHARGSPPSSKVTQQEITDYISHFELKSQVFLQSPTKLDEEECVKLGKKDADTEVEKFIQANTQELAKDKWLCPLSGKKFKGPEFVRKHIYNKHGEKIEEVKKEVEYFNNYLMDPKRAQLPEHPSNRTPGHRTDMHAGNMGGPPFHGGPFPPPMPPYGFGPRGPGPNFPGFGGQNYGRGPDMYRNNYGKRNFQRRSPRADPRKLVTYRDLDAPDDLDVF